MKYESRYWKRGEMKAFAEAAGIRPSHLSEILHRRRGVSIMRAVHLAALSEDMFGFDRAIGMHCWAFNTRTSHKAFFGTGSR